MAEIIPTIIAKNFAELEEKIRRLEPVCGRAHIDIMDGLFVADKTIGPEEVERLETELSLEVHLMVQKPENHITRWLQTSADKFLVHASSTQKMREIIDPAHEAECQLYAVLNPETPHAALNEYIDELDGVQFMTVHPGRYGAPFLPEVVSKIEEFHFLYPDLRIEVDGGINPETIGGCAQAGASIFAVGSYIWKSRDISKAIAELSKALE